MVIECEVTRLERNNVFEILVEVPYLRIESDSSSVVQVIVTEFGVMLVADMAERMGGTVSAMVAARVWLLPMARPEAFPTSSLATSPK